MKVLLVEDDAALAEALAAALAEAGLLIESTTTGQEADFLVRTERYDAVILDLGLP
ncbi:MAG: response regulator, partial [Pseudomonadota bacterium]|nr:response regulator [Pseudomonadota bacterium]